MVAVCHGAKPTSMPSAVVIFDYGTGAVFGCSGGSDFVFNER